MKKFFDDGHANNRLAGCFCRYKDKTHLIERGRKEYVILDNGTRVDINDKDLDLYLDKLGYVNVPRGCCYYLTRGSRRMWKSGLERRNVKQLRPSGIEAHMMGLRQNIGAMMEDIDFLYKGKYPSVKEAVLKVKKFKVLGMAFSKNFCVSRVDYTESIMLFYKGMEVGHFDEDNNVFIIGDMHKYILEELSEVNKEYKVWI